MPTLHSSRSTGLRKPVSATAGVTRWPFSIIEHAIMNAIENEGISTTATIAPSTGTALIRILTRILANSSVVSAAGC